MESDHSEEMSLELECHTPIPNQSDGEEENIDHRMSGIAVRGHIPHQFEPLARLPVQEDRQNRPEAEPEGDLFRGRSMRREHLDWCRCGHCQVLPHFRDEECRCCQEVEETRQVAEEKAVLCITQIPDFEPAILNPTVLQLAWQCFTQHYRKAARAFNQRGNEKYRYAAYRQLVRLCWGYLGRHIRVYTPACAHAIIDATYPDQRNRYRGTVILPLRDVEDNEDDDFFNNSDYEDEVLD